MSLTKERLMTMLQMQDSMNKKVNPDWLAANYPWTRAIVVEGAEALEHYGWKWWKKQEPDLAQFKIELVDIWHFILSHYVRRNDGHLESACGTILGMLTASYFEQGLSVGPRFHYFEDSSILQLLEQLIGLAASGSTNPRLFEVIMQRVDMSWDELYRSYVGKNVLNFFRQDHGYKDGTYRKIWNGEEDNVWLARIMEQTDDPDVIYHALRTNYAGAN